jgi:hypothetical protein
MRLSLALYQQTRQALRDALEPAVNEGLTRFALYGAGEAAELAYLTLREFGLEPVAVYADAGPERFLGLPVRPIAEAAAGHADRLIVAVFDPSIDTHLAMLRRVLPGEQLIVLARSARHRTSRRPGREASSTAAPSDVREPVRAVMRDGGV